MKKHIPNFITCLNVLTGAVGIVYMTGDRANDLAIFFVLVAAFWDFLDGMVARLLNVQSEIGKQLDSLADMVSFGVLPALVLMHLIDGMADVNSDSQIAQFVSLIGLLIVPFSAIRLAKFNLATDQSDEFKGLPTPANALMITAIAFSKSEALSMEILIVISVTSCFLLVSNIPMIALKFKNMGWKGNELRFILILIEVIGLGVFQLSFIPFVIPTYIVVSIVGNLLRGTVVS